MRLTLTLLIAAAATLVAVPSSASYATGTLNLRVTVPVLSTLVQCPAEVPPDATDCRARSGSALIRGLGRVSERYTWSYRLGPPTCDAGLAKPLATSGRLIVAGKGEIQFALELGSRCIELEPVRNEPQDFTITGGTGAYEGASGSGTVERAISSGSGSETWVGTLSVPGLEFDITPPTLRGASSKTVRAPKGATRVRITYQVTASDAVQGKVPVTCRPRSGSRFPIGRTAVRCLATDSSGNTGRASFGVTVRRAG